MTHSAERPTSPYPYFHNPYNPACSKTAVLKKTIETRPHVDFRTQTTDPALATLKVHDFRTFCSANVFDPIYDQQHMPPNKRKNLMREISEYYHNLFQQNIFSNQDLFCEATSCVLRCFSVLLDQHKMANEEEKLYFIYQTIVVTRISSKQEIDEQAFRTILQILSKNKNQSRIEESCNQYAESLYAKQKDGSFIEQKRACGIMQSCQEMIKRGEQFNDPRISNVGRRILRKLRTLSKADQSLI